MKVRIQGLLTAVVVVALALVVTPIKALAHDHDGWHHDHGNHNGWYKHHGGCDYPGYANGYPGGWHHHHWDDDDDNYEGQGYGYNGYGGYGYNGSSGYPMPAPILPPAGYATGPAYGYGYNGLGYNGIAPNMGKWMRRQQTASQRLSANQALYQAAMSQGNYALANKAAAHIQKQSAILNAANSMMGGAAAYPGYAQPLYGAAPYNGQPGYGAQPGASPLGSILQMFGY